jgi:hypothetical protein
MMIRLKKLGCICGVVCLVGILLAGCTEEETKILPNMVLSVTTINFGSVIVNEASAMQTVTLSNPNDQAVTVVRVTSTNAAFRVGGYYAANGELDPLVVPFTIPKLAASTLYLKFYPTETTAYTGKIVIESADTNVRTETNLVDLQGIGIPVPTPTPTL